MKLCGPVSTRSSGWHVWRGYVADWIPPIASLRPGPNAHVKGSSPLRRELSEPACFNVGLSIYRRALMGRSGAAVTEPGKGGPQGAAGPTKVVKQAARWS